ncbi:hypothetical protein AVEN_30567-1 [Araneus ventricosus]|uniref:Uncharacterized protein n=1 Tax=Araneus ventricosus TaxID=182803 RepID=A0A4Y2H6S6_ARAVE|nr:hypothetical protein AVEN_30567-1 [Araneus ventricosus]
MTDSSHVWTPDLGDFGDEIWDLKGAGIVSIFPLGEKAGLDYKLLLKSKNPPNETRWKLRSSEAVILSFLLFNLTDKEGFLKGFWEQQKELDLILHCFLPKNKKGLLRMAQMNRESPDDSGEKMTQDSLILYYFP